LKSKSGVYSITINNKIYIGSSVSIRDRWRQHRHLLLRRKHSNKYLQNAYIKYGKARTVFSILEETSPILDILLEREQYWIDTLKTYLHKNGYNLRRNAGSNLGLHIGGRKKGSISWNKGLTKQTDRRVKRGAKSLSKAKKILIASGELKRPDEYLSDEENLYRLKKSQQSKMKKYGNPFGLNYNPKNNIPTKESRRKNSNAHKGKTPWNKGRKWEKSVKDKIRNTLLKRKNYED